MTGLFAQKTQPTALCYTLHNMHGLLKCCYQVSAFARLAVPYKAHAIEGMGRLVAAPVWQKSAYFASRSTDGDQEAYRVMLRPLYRPELQYATSKYMSCFFRPVYEDGEVVDKTEDTELTNKLEQLLQSTGCRQSLQDFTDEVDNVDMAAYGESVPSGGCPTEAGALKHLEAPGP